MLPEKVKIGGMTYTVKEVVGLEQKHGIYGHILYGFCEIEIDNRIADDRKEEVFIHELIHACLNEAGYTDQSEMEDMVNRLALVLHQVLKDNKFQFEQEVGVM